MSAVLLVSLRCSEFPAEDHHLGARQSHSSLLLGMFVLPVAALRPLELPPILPQHSNDIPDLHEWLDFDSLSALYKFR